MSKFAVLRGSLVENIIVADSKEIAEEVTNTTCIEFDDNTKVSIGFIWDGEIFISNLDEETIVE